MPKRKKIIQDKKLRGEWAEMQFMARAAEHDLSVSKPFGESRNFDFVVGTQGHFISVQVKSTTNEFEGGFVCNIGSGDHSYTAGAFDFIAAYIVPEDAWYIIPEKKIRGMRCISLFTKSKESKYEPFREAWHLLREAAGTGEEPGPVAEEVPAAGSAAGGAEQSAASAPKYPQSVVDRVRACMEFARRQMGMDKVRAENPDDA